MTQHQATSAVVVVVIPIQNITRSPRGAYMEPRTYKPGASTVSNRAGIRADHGGYNQALDAVTCGVKQMIGGNQSQPNIHHH
jgi:hypothetical protein